MEVVVYFLIENQWLEWLDISNCLIYNVWCLLKNYMQQLNMENIVCFLINLNKVSYCDQLIFLCWV